MPHSRLLRMASALAMLLAACQHAPPRPLSPVDSAAELAARSLKSAALGDFVAAARGAPLPTWPPRRWDLDLLSLAAIYFHPELDVARAQARRAAAAIETAGARPNPTLSVSPEFSSNPGAGVSPWLAAIHLDWPLETAGKRARRIERAQASAAAARFSVLGAAWRVRCELATSLLALLAARRRCASLQEEADQERHLLALTEDRVAAGSASAIELTPVRLTFLQTTADLAAARGDLPERQARLAAAIGVTPAALDGIELVAPPAAGASPLANISAAEARRRALLARADIRAQLADYDAAEAALRLELARQYPDVHLGSGYQFDQGQNKWALGLSVDLPLLDRNEGPIAEALAARAESEAAFVAEQAKVLAEVESALARREAGWVNFAELGAVAAESGENLRRVRSQVELGAADRTAEIGAGIETQRAARAAAQAESALQQSLVDLECAVQDPFLASQWIEQPRGGGGGAGGAGG